jgi:hypothetical protein
MQGGSPVDACRCSRNTTGRWHGTGKATQRNMLPAQCHHVSPRTCTMEPTEHCGVSGRSPPYRGLGRSSRPTHRHTTTAAASSYELSGPRLDFFFFAHVADGHPAARRAAACPPPPAPRTFQISPLAAFPLLSLVVSSPCGHCSPPRTCSRSGARRGRGPACEDDRPHQEGPGSSRPHSSSQDHRCRCASRPRAFNPPARLLLPESQDSRARGVRAYGATARTGRRRARPSLGGLERACSLRGKPRPCRTRGRSTQPAPSREPAPARAVGRSVVVLRGGRPRRIGRAIAPLMARRRGGTPVGHREAARLCAQPHHGLPIPSTASLDHAAPMANGCACSLPKRGRRKYSPKEAGSASTVAAYKSDGTAKTLYDTSLHTLASRRTRTGTSKLYYVLIGGMLRFLTHRHDKNTARQKEYKVLHHGARRQQARTAHHTLDVQKGSSPVDEERAKPRRPFQKIAGSGWSGKRSRRSSK